MHELGGSKARCDGVLPGAFRLASWQRRVTLGCGPTPCLGESSDRSFEVAPGRFDGSTKRKDQSLHRYR